MIITGKKFGLAVIWILCLSVLMAGCGGLKEQAPKTEVEPQEKLPAVTAPSAEKPVETQKEPEQEVQPVETVQIQKEPVEAAKVEAKPEEQAPAVELALKFKVGDSTRYKAITEISRSVETEGPAKQESQAFKGGSTGTTVETIFTQRVQSVNDKGNAIVEITIEQIKYLAKVTDRIAVDFDSTKQEDPNSALSKLIGQSYTIELTPLGKVARIVDSSKARAVTKGSAPAQRAAARLLLPNAIEQRHTISALATLGGKRIRPGGNWSSVETLSFGMMGSKSYERIYTLKEIEDVSGRQIAVVEMTAVPSTETAEQLHQEDATGVLSNMFDTNEKYSGLLRLDLTTGKVEEYFEKLRTQWVAVDPSPEDGKEPSSLKMTAIRYHRIEKLD